MKTLELKPVSRTDHLVHPEEFSDLDWDSPALEVFTDFRFHHPQAITKSIRALEAISMMEAAHLKLMLVVDRDDEFEGVISAADLTERRIIQHTLGGLKRDELLVADIMHRREEMLALEYESLKTATILDLVEALRNRGQPYCLVIDSKQHHIRGLISSNEIAHRLHFPIEIAHRNSFVDIFEALHH